MIFLFLYGSHLRPPLENEDLLGLAFVDDVFSLTDLTYAKSLAGGVSFLEGDDEEEPLVEVFEDEEEDEESDDIADLVDLFESEAFSEEELTNLIESDYSSSDSDDFALALCDVGIVVSVADAIVGVKGLADVCYGEMVSFSKDIISSVDVVGLVLNLELQKVGVVVLGDDINILPGDFVCRNFVLMNVPTGDHLLGRVVDPLGNPIDGLLNVESDSELNSNSSQQSGRFLESRAPSIISRSSVNTPLETGLKILDSMVPIGHGQRELILEILKQAKLR